MGHHRGYCINICRGGVGFGSLTDHLLLFGYYRSVKRGWLQGVVMIGGRLLGLDGDITGVFLGASIVVVAQGVIQGGGNP